MKPFVLLLIVFIISAAVSKLVSGNWSLPFSGNLAMCIMLWFTALGHFKFKKGMSMMVPGFIPYKTSMVVLTGVLEILLGAGLLFPALRQASGIALILFLILMLPANIYAAIHTVNYEKATYDGPGLKYLWFRVPLQVVFILWIYYFSVK